MNDKFSIRHLAFSLVPVISEDEAVRKIKKAALDNDLDDMKTLELIRQVNVANQYHAFKKANFTVNSEYDVLTLDPSKLFSSLAKVAAFKSSRTTPSFFTNLKNKNSEMSKTAALDLNPATQDSERKEVYSFLKKVSALVQEGDSGKAYSTSVQLRDQLGRERIRIKQAFVTECSALDAKLAPFPVLRQKYAAMVDERNIDNSVSKHPTALDVIKVNASLEKMAELTDALSHINTMLDILEKKGE